jgi:hypothetical protein
MKIRLFNDSVRIRLTQAEVEALAAGGILESVIPFPGEAFVCTVQPTIDNFEAHQAGGRLTVLVPKSRTAAWASSSEEGMYAELPAASVGRVLRVAVEKDYRCIHKPGSPDSAGAFPNPAEIGD